jgi:ABC-2 type transport system ATP-binding protein
MPVIEAHDLVKRYGDVVALDRVSFTVEQGEIFGILGPNGAGKTTAVEIAAGLRRADGGSVRVLDLDPRSDGTDLRERLGIQLQQSQLPDQLKVWEALDLYASFYRNPRPWEELLGEWGLTEKRDAKFGTLSGGQRQRLFIALSLVGNPELVFLDELTTGLDPQARRTAWKLIREIRASGVTVVLVSHYMDEVQELTDRVAIFDRGRVVAVDSPAGLIARVDAEHSLTFRPTAPLDAALLEELPGVSHVDRSGDYVVVTGRGDFASDVTGALARNHILVAELRLEERSLDDAYLSLTGHKFETSGDLS